MNQIESTITQVQNLYTKNLEFHGAGSKSVGWKDEESQLLRFQQLCEGITESSFSVNDLGCGYGAMYDWLSQAFPLSLSHYYGYDISPEMLLEAQKRILSPSASWIESRALHTTADYSFASGIFNVSFGVSESLWEAYIRDTLENMWEHSRKGMAFNLLTSYVDYRDKDLYYADPCVYFDYCKRHFSRYVSLLHNTDLWEWTIIIQKTARSTETIEVSPSTHNFP